MLKEKKTYTDLFIDNLVNPKKRGIYFGNEQEEAIVRFNSHETSQQEKFYLFEEVISPVFKKTILGVLEMPMFHNLGKLNRDELIDNTFYRLIEKINKFQPNMIGKSGQPVKAYSYFSTIAKNHILEQKVRNEKILKHKADVESSIDLNILSEDTLQKMSNYDKQDVHFDSYENIFKETRDKILLEIEKVIAIEENKEKPDNDLIKIGYCLKYLIKKWDKIEFMKKNEFMRILSLYVGLRQQQVSLLFKKYKVAVLENINPSLLNKNKSLAFFKEDKDEKDELELEDEVNYDKDIESDEPFDDELIDENNQETEETDEFVMYKVNSMEEFEIETERISNLKLKNKK